MAHVHGAGGTTAAHVATAAVAKTAEHGMEGMMKHMMGEATVSAARPFHNLAKGAATTGAVAAANSTAGRSFMAKILKHPLVLFGVGVAVGYLVHKHRKEIIDTANRVAEKSKDFVLQQRENLEDLVAESRESEN